MTGFWIGVLVSVATGAVVNECCDVAPWLAERVVRRAARLWAYGDPELAQVYGEEWVALIREQPGKLTKLVVALRFLAGGVARAPRRRLRKFREARACPKPQPQLSDLDQRLEEIWRVYRKQCRPLYALAIIGFVMVMLPPALLLAQHPTGALVVVFGVFNMFTAMSRLRDATRDFHQALIEWHALSGRRPRPPSPQPEQMATRMAVGRFTALLTRIRRLSKLLRTFRLEISLALYSRTLTGFWLG